MFLFSSDRPPTSRSSHQPPVPPQRPGLCPAPASFGGRCASVCFFLNISPRSFPGTFLEVKVPCHFYSDSGCRGRISATKIHLNSITGWPFFHGTIQFHGTNRLNYFTLLGCFLHWKFVSTCECLSRINYRFVIDPSLLLL